MAVRLEVKWTFTQIFYLIPIHYFCYENRNLRCKEGLKLVKTLIFLLYRWYAVLRSVVAKSHFCIDGCVYPAFKYLLEK